MASLYCKFLKLPFIMSTLVMHLRKHQKCPKKLNVLKASITRAVESQLGPWCDLQDRGLMGGVCAEGDEKFSKTTPFRFPENEGNALFKNIYTTLSRQIDGHSVSHKNLLYRDFAAIIKFYYPIYLRGPGPGPITLPTPFSTLLSINIYN